MRLVYLGTPEIAVPPLRALVTADHDVCLVVTGADRRRGRGGAATPSPVKIAALELGIDVTHQVDDALDVGAELGVVVAFGRIIKSHVLDVLPMVNLHFSRLPRWRGAAPVERALLAGDTETAVAVMDVEEGLDTGGIHAEVTVPIGPRATADELRTDLVRAGTDLIVATLAGGHEALVDPRPQTGEITYAAKLHPADRYLAWDRPAVELDRVVRVGGSWTTFRGDRFEVVAAEPTSTVGHPGILDGDEVGTGDGSLRLVTVKRQGRGAVSFRDFSNGVHLRPDERLGS